MTAPPLDRQHAASRTRLAQVGVIAAIACGGGIMAFGLPGVTKPAMPKPLDLPVLDPGAGQTPVETAQQTVANLGAAADRFGLISNRPTQPQIPTAPIDLGKDAEASPPPPPPPPSNDVKFLGVVHLGTMKMALISTGEKQSFISVGGKIGDDTISAISETEITLGDKSIELTPKGSDMVTRVGSAGSSGAGALSGLSGKGNALGGTNRGQNPAMAAAIAAKAAAARAGNIRAQPQPSMGISMAPFPDPARNNRYQQLLEKYRAGGEYQSESDIQEAAMKQTDNEAMNGQVPGFDAAQMKKQFN